MKKFDKLLQILTNYKKFDKLLRKKFKNSCKEYRRVRVILENLSKNVEKFWHWILIKLNLKIFLENSRKFWELLKIQNIYYKV